MGVGELRYNDGDNEMSVLFRWRWPTRDLSTDVSSGIGKRN